MLDRAWSPSDPIEFKRGFRRSWQLGNVVKVEPHRLKVRTPRRQEYWIEPGRKGRVRKPSGPRLDQLVCLIHAAQRAKAGSSAAPVVPGPGTNSPSLPVSLLRAVPRPRARYRDGAYLDNVRRWACLGCDAPAPSEAHHAGPRGVGQRADDFCVVPLCRRCHQVVTDTGCLPGRDAAQTELIILRAQVVLLVEWAGRDRLALVADHCAAPSLGRGVA